MALPIIVTILINGMPLECGKVKPTLHEGQVRVPLRMVMEKIGGTVNWNVNNWDVFIERDSKKIWLRAANQTTYTGINYAPWQPGTPLSSYDWFFDPDNIAQNVTVLVPLRFLAEQFALKLTWDAKTKTVSVVDSGVTGVK